MTIRIDIPPILTNKDCERILGELRSNHDEECQLECRDGPKLQAETGAAALFIQFLLTWQKQKKASLYLEWLSTSNLDDDLSHFASIDLNVLLLLSARQIFAGTEKSEITADAKRVALEQLSLVDSNHIENIVSKDSLLLLCSDDTSYGYLSHFYQKEKDSTSLKSKSTFRTLTEELILAFGDKSMVADLPRLTGEINTVIYELFKNTHEHARNAFTGETIPLSRRGIYARNYQNVHESIVSPGPLRDYVGQLKEKFGRASIFEISIFDAGSGLARHWRRQELNISTSLADEYEAIQNCLEKHSTTTGDSRRGFGLHDVMRTVEKADGFLRVRTGRLSLYRNFFAGAPKLDIRTYLWDWNNKAPKYSLQSDVAGTLLSVFIPLKVD
jgi:hypothetical protein